MSFLTSEEHMVRYERRVFEEGYAKPAARSGHVMLTCEARDSVILHGGLGISDLEFWNDTWEYKSSTGQWSPLNTTGATPANAFGQCATMLRDGVTLFVQGGLGNRNRHFDDAFVLDTKTLVWTQLELTGDAIPKMWGQSVVSVLVNGEEQLVLFGGMAQETASPDVFVINPATWAVKRVDFAFSSKLQCPARRRHGAVVLKDSFMMVAGGRSEREFFNDVWLLNCVTMMWVPVTASAPPSAMREFLANPTEKQHGVLICKLFERAPKQNKKAYEFYSSWYPRTGLSMAVCNNTVYVFGGFFYCSQGLASFDDLHAYDVTEHRWERVVTVANSVVESEVDDSPVDAPPRCTMAGMAALPNASNGMLFFGGRIRDDPIDAHYQLTLTKPQRSLAQIAAQWLKGCPAAVDCSQTPNRVQAFVHAAQAYRYSNPKHDPSKY